MPRPGWCDCAQASHNSVKPCGSRRDDCQESHLWLRMARCHGKHRGMGTTLHYTAERADACVGQTGCRSDVTGRRASVRAGCLWTSLCLASEIYYPVTVRGYSAAGSPPWFEVKKAGSLERLWMLQWSRCGTDQANVSSRHSTCCNVVTKGKKRSRRASRASHAYLCDATPSPVRPES